MEESSTDDLYVLQDEPWDRHESLGQFQFIYYLIY